MASFLCCLASVLHDASNAGLTGFCAGWRVLRRYSLAVVSRQRCAAAAPALEDAAPPPAAQHLRSCKHGAAPLYRTPRGLLDLLLVTGA